MLVDSVFAGAGVLSVFDSDEEADDDELSALALVGALDPWLEFFFA